jgi:hypothetical protein
MVRIHTPELSSSQPGTGSGTPRILQRNTEPVVSPKALDDRSDLVGELRRVAAAALGLLAADDVEAARDILSRFLRATR